MSAKSKGILLFIGVKQGSENNKNNIYAYFKRSIAREAHKWIRNVYGKELLVKDRENYSTLIPQITEEDKAYKDNMNDAIIDRLKYINIHEEKINMQKTCLEALKG